MINLTSKLPKVSNSIFSVMSDLATKHQAINLSQGYPDYEVDPELVKLVTKEMKNGRNQYAPMAGILSLRDLLSKKIEHLYKSYYSPDTEITITAGGTQAIFTAIATLIRPNDEAIIFEPAYDCYAPTIKAMGGLVKSFEMHPPFYDIDWEMVKKLVTVNTKLIIVNSPHNPTGRIINNEDITQLIKITTNTDIAIISDEVYEHITYNQAKHLSLAKYPELKERTFIVASFGKLFHNTGWKVGYCASPAYLMTEFRKMHQYQIFSVNTPIQYAYETYLRNPDTYLGLSLFFQKKRDLFAALLKESKFTLLSCQGSYFQNVSYEQLSEEKDVDFAKRLLIDYKVACIPNSAFYSKGANDKTLRFCFAKKEETLERAANQLIKVKALLS